MLERLKWKAKKGVGVNSILCQLFGCWAYKRCSGIRGKLKEDSKFKCHARDYQQTYIENCPVIGEKKKGFC